MLDALQNNAEYAFAVIGVRHKRGYFRMWATELVKSGIAVAGGVADRCAGVTLARYAIAPAHAAIGAHAEGFATADAEWQHLGSHHAGRGAGPGNVPCSAARKLISEVLIEPQIDRLPEYAAHDAPQGLVFGHVANQLKLGILDEGD